MKRSVILIDRLGPCVVNESASFASFACAVEGAR